ncbi:hypothetical protein GJAV_G00114780 [Gymnothorax javanicus]|nr:hypothetical protein GJAV_G00114780 [Gymnothorax javanicus]
MSLTCHFIDAEWTRKQVVLNTRAMHGSHTGEYLKETFLSMLEDWKICKHRVALVLQDSRANIVKGMRLAELPDLSCTAHTLQLVVNDGLSSQRAVTDVIAILKKCATHFHHSIMAKLRLRDIQRELGLPEHNINQAFPTRWDSTLHMLHRMLEQKRVLTIYCGEHGGFAGPADHQAKGWLKEEEDAATQQTTREEHAATEGASMEEQAAAEEASVEEQEAAYGTHENDGNTHKRQQREHKSFRSRVDEMFSSLLAPRTGDLLASSCVEDELHLYLKEPVIDRQKGDPLQ